MRVLGSEVVVDIGYKSEGVISTEEFEDATKIEPGTSIEVLLELIEADTGLMGALQTLLRRHDPPCELTFESDNNISVLANGGTYQWQRVNAQ